MWFGKLELVLLLRFTHKHFGSPEVGLMASSP